MSVPALLFRMLRLASGVLAVGAAIRLALGEDMDPAIGVLVFAMLLFLAVLPPSLREWMHPADPAAPDSLEA